MNELQTGRVIIINNDDDDDDDDTEQFNKNLFLLFTPVGLATLCVCMYVCVCVFVCYVCVLNTRPVKPLPPQFLVLALPPPPPTSSLDQ